MRAVGEVGDRRAGAGPHARPSATLGAAVLGVDRLDRLLLPIDAHLDELPVALVLAGVDDPAVLGVLHVPAPVLQPAPAAAGRHRAPVGRRWQAFDARDRVALARVVDVDGAVALQQRAVVGPRAGRRDQDEGERERRYKCARSFQVVSAQPGNGMPSMTRWSWRVKIEMPVFACPTVLVGSRCSGPYSSRNIVSPSMKCRTP